MVAWTSIGERIRIQWRMNCWCLIIHPSVVIIGSSTAGGLSLVGDVTTFENCGEIFKMLSSLRSLLSPAMMKWRPLGYLVLMML